MAPLYDPERKSVFSSRIASPHPSHSCTKFACICGPHFAFLSSAIFKLPPHLLQNLAPQAATLLRSKCEKYGLVLIFQTYTMTRTMKISKALCMSSLLLGRGSVLKQKIQAIYRGRDFLEVTLQLDFVHFSDASFARFWPAIGYRFLQSA